MTPAYGPKTLSFLRVKSDAVKTPRPGSQMEDSLMINPSGRLRDEVLVSCT